MAQGIWHQVSPWRLLGLLAVEAVLLALMLTITSYGSKKAGFPRGDRIAITFAGSKKSLAAGLPMASVLFGAQAGLAVLPLMLFHQMQLMVCAVLAKRYAAQAPGERESGGGPGGGDLPGPGEREAGGRPRLGVDPGGAEQAGAARPAHSAP